jgi:stromal membrane-associated protein
VDLDSWTDEQMQSILSWGNARANKYWEAKLTAAHVPSEAKIENFIRTKYELKRWVMEGPMPDPASLDVEGDDDIPLSIVKEKQNIERKESIRKASVGQSSAPRKISAPQQDLIGSDDLPPRASTAGPSAAQVPPKAAPAPPKSTAAKDSLFGLDFLADTPAAPPRPSSTTGTAGGSGTGQSRPDLKQSILSLYASAPRPQQPQHQHQSSGSFGGFGGMQSPTMQSPTFGHQSKKSNSGLDDAFAGLSFGGMSTPKSPQKDAFAGLTSMTSNRPTPQSTSAFSNLSGGGFFDSKPKPTSPQHQQQPSIASSSGFGDWGVPMAAPAKPAAPASSAMGDLFDLSSPAPVPQPAAVPSKPTPTSDVFNLSQPKPAQPAAPAAAPMASMNTSGFGGADVWGNAWSEPAAPAALAAAPAQKSPQAIKRPTTFVGSDMGWGNSSGSLANTPIVPGQSGGFNTTGGFSMAPPPKVSADEDFGGWASGASPQTSNNTNSKPTSGFGGNDDLFSNVWQ